MLENLFDYLRLVNKADKKEFLDGKISRDEFRRRWQELWGHKGEHWRETVYAELYELFDRRLENEEVLKNFRESSDEYERSYPITEEQLREELKRYLKELEACDD